MLTSREDRFANYRKAQGNSPAPEPSMQNQMGSMAQNMDFIRNRYAGASPTMSSMEYRPGRKDTRFNRPEPEQNSMQTPMYRGRNRSRLSGESSNGQTTDWRRLYPDSRDYRDVGGSQAPQPQMQAPMRSRNPGGMGQNITMDIPSLSSREPRNSVGGMNYQSGGRDAYRQRYGISTPDVAQQGKGSAAVNMARYNPLRTERMQQPRNAFQGSIDDYR